jgi:hypothetical protein
VLLGKTTMPDYGMLSSGLSSLHGVTRNPWRLDRNDPRNALAHIAFTVPFSMSEQPAASVNWSYGTDGLPIGVQIVGGGWTTRACSRWRSCWRSCARHNGPGRRADRSEAEQRKKRKGRRHQAQAQRAQSTMNSRAPVFVYERCGSALSATW